MFIVILSNLTRYETNTCIYG